MLVAGFLFRYLGIVKNLSFWNDETHTAIFARGILWYGKPVTEIGAGTGLYQQPLYYITAFFFKIFGISEFSARLPSVIAGTLFIGIVYYITKKVVGRNEAYIASFLTAFSQMQLAWSTQLRPYIWLEIFTFLVMYLCYKSLRNKIAIIDKYLLMAVAFSFIALLFHGTGFINIVLVGTIILFKSFMNKKYLYAILLVPLAIVSFLIVYYSLSPINRSLPYVWRFIFETLHYRVFLKANYSWLILGAFAGSLYLFVKNKLYFITLVFFTVTIFAFAIFKVNPYYVRYSLPAFPLLYELFAIGVVFISKLLTISIKNNVWKNVISSTIIILILFLVTKQNDKIKFIPSYYYTINGDMRENPIVDYKKAFSVIGNLIKGKNNVIVMDAWNDRVPWYLPGQKFIFLIQHRPSNTDPLFGETMISTIQEYEREKSKYKSGVVLIENWESLTSPELQQHIQKTLKRELDVQNLPYNENDRWSITVFSWGMEQQL